MEDISKLRKCAITDRRAMEKARRFTRDNIALVTFDPRPTPHIMAKHKAVFDKRVSLPCHVRRRGNMNDASTSAANSRKIDKFHKGHVVA